MRLVFADWLEDNGDPDRAEFIRLQVRLAQLPEYDPARFDLEERSQDLLAEHHARWLAHLPKWARAVELTFRRGLPEEVKMSPATWVRHGARLAELVPLRRLEIIPKDDPCKLAEVARLCAEVGVSELECSPGGESAETVAEFFGRLRGNRLRRLFVGYGEGLIGQLLAWPGLSHLTGLRIMDWFCKVSPILSSPDIGPLEWLNLSDKWVGPAEAAALAANERLVGLRHLEMGSIEGAGRLLARSRWSRLEHLGLVAGGKDLRELLAAGWARGIRSLNLCITERWADPSRVLGQAQLPRLEDFFLKKRMRGPAWVENLGASDLAPGLSSLVICAEDEDVAALANGNFPKLHRLFLFDCRAGAAGVVALVDSVRLRSLRELHLFGRSFDSSGAGAALANCAGMERLQALTLTDAHLDDADCTALAASPHVSQLTRLKLLASGVTDSRLRVLLSAVWLPRVRELSLPVNQITDRGLGAIAACPALSRLRLLDLECNPISSAGAAALANSPYLGRLSRLVLPTSRINRKTQDQLRERFGNALVLME